MTERTRQHLRNEFRDGERPSGADFADIFDSTVNLQDDGITIDAAKGTMVLASGLRLGTSSDAVAGTLRFAGNTLQVHDGTGFQLVGAGTGSGAFEPVGGGPDVTYTQGGTVGIGEFGDSPADFRFEVRLGANSGTAERVRLGTLAAFTDESGDARDAAATLSHHRRADEQSYALRQEVTGRTVVNAPEGSSIQFTRGGDTASAIMTILSDARVLIARNSPLAQDGIPSVRPELIRLHVNGSAIKNDGTDTWLIASDARVKEDVADFGAGLDVVRAVRPVSFRYNGKAGTRKGQAAVGVIGQEIETVLPETVTTVQSVEDGIEDLRLYRGGALTYALVNAVKELAGRVERLEAALAGAQQDGGT